MSQQQIEKRTVAGVSFTGTATGKLEVSEIPNDDYKSHFIRPADTKSKSSYPVVSAEGNLMRGNVRSAWEFCDYGDNNVCSEARKLGKVFDDNPIPDSAYKRSFEKRVSIEKADAERRVVTGMCMVPWSVDSQNDFEKPGTIRSLSEDFMERLATGDAQNGVMHAVFSDDDLSHVENRVLDSSEKLNGTEYPAGSWQIGVKVHNDDLWQLVSGDDPALSGFSIGGYIHESKEYDADSLPPEVGTATKADGTVREITDATIKEVSIVDTPAVPQATIQVAKDADGFAKADDRLTAGVDTATNYLVEERGHSESDAREIATYLNGVGKSATASGDSGSWLSKAKRFFTRRNTSHDEHDMTDDETEKQGRVLSGENVEKAMAVHDIAIDLLDGTDVRQNRLRFTDDVSTDFDVADYAHELKAAQKTAEPAESGRDADGDTLESMTDENEMDEFAELVAEKLREDGDNDDAQTDEKNADSEGEDEATSKVDDLAETVEQLAENQQQILERIENAEGVSQQKASTSANAGSETWGKSSPFAPAGGSHE